MRLLLLSTTTGYQAGSFLAAARALGMEVILGTDRCHVLEDPWGDGAIALRFNQPENNAAILANERFDAIAAIGDAPAETAAVVAERLGIPLHSPQGARAARDKLLSRQLLSAAGLLVPGYAVAKLDWTPKFPCVLKPIGMSASRGVIRADTPTEYAAAFARITALGAESIVVEDFIAGREFAIEGIVDHGRLQALAIFDKPDPLDGPFFEETIYVTPSRLEPKAQAEIVETVARACTGLGLSHGPIHAEARWNDRGAWILEVAARPIGGLCSRALHFNGSESLESLILRHALGQSIADAQRDPAASGVMMIPIAEAGVYNGVEGVSAALEIPFVTGIEITAKVGQRLIPWPEGSSYLGFIFSEAPTSAEAEQALRLAHRQLHFDVSVVLPVIK